MRLRDVSEPPSNAGAQFVIFSRFVRHHDGTDVRCLLRPDGRYHLVVAEGDRQAERLISREAAHAYFIDSQDVEAVLYAIEDLKRDLHRADP
jgi:hypothetical protein